MFKTSCCFIPKSSLFSSTLVRISLSYLSNKRSTKISLPSLGIFQIRCCTYSRRIARQFLGSKRFPSTVRSNISQLFTPRLFMASRNTCFHFGSITELNHLAGHRNILFKLMLAIIPLPTE